MRTISFVPIAIVVLTLSALCDITPSQIRAAEQDGKGSDSTCTPDQIISKGTYPGWPWIDRTPSGKLVCVWREGTRHVFSAEGKLMLSESSDEGQTWSEPRTFFDEPNIDDRNVAILTLSDTDWMTCFNTYTSDNVSRAFVLRTKDGGATWSKPQMLCDFDARTRSAPIKLATGEFVLPFYREPPLQSLAAVSSDDGHTWKIVEIENVDGFLGDEWSVAEVSKGRLVGIIRNSAPGGIDGTFYKTESRDRGLTWSKPLRTNLRDARSASPAQIFVYQGRPIVLYANKRMVSTAMAVSNDPELLNWNVSEQLHCYQYHGDGSPIDDGSYPVSAAVGGNRRLIVDYVHDGNLHAIAAYFVEMPQSWFEK